MNRWWRGVGVFVVTVVLVAASFITATTIALVRLQHTGDDARGIIENAVPSVREVVTIRAEVALVRAHVVRYLETPTASERNAISDTLARIRERAEEYNALPTYWAERRLKRELLLGVEALASAVEHAIERHATGDLSSAWSEFEAIDFAARRLDAVLKQSERINLDQVQTFTRAMEATRRASTRNLILLNALCAGFAALLLVWALRTARRQHALETSYTELLRERAAEMETFAGRVAHDILSPLTSTALVLERLSASADEQISSGAHRGLRGLDKVRSTVDGLLEFARAGAQPAEGVTIDAFETSAEVVAGFEEQARAASVHLEFSASAGSCELHASRGVFMSILGNLIQNAIKYTAGAPVARVEVHLDHHRERLRVEVRDTGPGIPTEMIGRIFEPYFRAKDQAQRTTGMGLGLATVKRLVEAHSGSVELRSTLGQGSTFTVELPACTAPLPSPRPALGTGR
jgi:signal transduction histidine kinase